MISVRRESECDHGMHGWLDARHTFAFGTDYDPRYVGYRALRVINGDQVRPGSGFGTNGNRDLELHSYVLDGALAHRDSFGNGSVLQPREVKCLTAGTGIQNCEFNPRNQTRSTATRAGSYPIGRAWLPLRPASLR